MGKAGVWLCWGRQVWDCVTMMSKSNMIMSGNKTSDYHYGHRAQNHKQDKLAQICKIAMGTLTQPNFKPLFSWFGIFTKLNYVTKPAWTTFKSSHQFLSWKTCNIICNFRTHTCTFTKDTVTHTCSLYSLDLEFLPSWTMSQSQLGQRSSLLINS